MSVRLVPRGGARSCAWCRDPVGAAARCEGCGTALHDGCARFVDGCPTLGCAGAPRRRARRLLDLPGLRATWLAALVLGVLSVSAAQAIPRLEPVAAARKAVLDPEPAKTAWGAPYLLGQLASPDAEVRLGAVWFLGDELAVDALAGRTRLAPDRRARIEQALARVAALDPSAPVRRSARQLLEDARAAAR